MSKVMNAAFGIGIAIILFIVVMLGTQVFYQEPSYEDYNCYAFYEKQMPYQDIYSCNDTITVAECKEFLRTEEKISPEQEKEMQECNERFNQSQKDYGKNIFIINCIIGVIFVITSLFLLSINHIAAGTAFAGIVLIVYGFMRGWRGTGDVLKFVVGLVVAGLFIHSALRVNIEKKK